MGRKTNIPGLYFSAPISLGGRFAGVAVAKIDLPKLSHWVNQTDAFISDEYGVIIVARDPALEMRALPDAAVARLSAAERLARYKRSDFPPLAIAPWGDQRFPWLHHFDRESQPLLISSRHLADEVLDVHAFKRLPFVAAFERERLKLFVLIGMSGTLVLSVAAGLVLFSRIRRRAAASAAESASLLRAAIESTVDGILAVDNDRRITACNQRFFDIWHIPPDLIASGRDEEMLNYVHAQVDDPQAFVDKVMDLYAHPESSSFDEVRFKDGTAVERYSSPQRLGERIVGRVWSFRDVTERKRAEQAIQDSHGELESKVRERTAALRSANLTLQAEKSLQEELNRQLAQAHGQLLQSEKMAAIGQLAAGVAHEINNPVGFVSSNLTTLRRYVADLLKLINCYERGEEEMREATRAGIDELKRKVDLDYLREDFEILMSESIDGMQRVKRIVEDLKDFAHVSEAVTQLTNIERGLDSTLNVVWNELKYKAEVVKEYGGVPEIECISSQLNQVFMNLLVNAAQAIEDRGRITIRTGREGQYVWVEVEDTGRGIPPEDLDRIFDPFFTTKPVGKGTGLGLSLSYGIVQKHHGRFEVRSEVGKGSVFRVWLPMTQPSTP